MSERGRLTITGWVHRQLESYVNHAECCVDATAGKGNDTLFLCRNMKPGGKVFAFDIQKAALDAAGELLCRNGFVPKDCASNGCIASGFASNDYAAYDFPPEDSKVRLILDGHEHMDRYLMPESVDVMMFNLGYLPGGDHKLATGAETTIAAIQKGLTLLKAGGVMSVCIYSGGDSGFAERDAVLPYLEGLDAKKYTVIVSRFSNKPNHPPIPVLIQKSEGFSS